ncbi:tRNA dimethylallyltransferase-like [Haliotis rufescens]|uniref:tRNA dimethylallyltransferase-like n=1 Tax=Haliotis rufescens TaxID=6454 RepID=UPI00201F61A8|nr:tRNA dimethylallyltransferase-like [Haliotis rufescens]
MMAAVRRLPVVVVLGATGTGKSKLAIELGQKFNGEIISADSMQIYEGLNIITNKVTSAEQHQCRHHLIGYVNPFTNTSNTVVNFRDRALPVIEKVAAEGKLPIIVGGTNYYIESLLWNFLVDPQAQDECPEAKKSRMSNSGPVIHERERPRSPGAGATPSGQLTTSGASSTRPGAPQVAEASLGGEVTLEGKGEAIPEDKGEITLEGSRKASIDRGTDREGGFKDIESSELHRQLTLVDPATAKKIHPHNRRKIIRALEVYGQHGVPLSDILKSQHASAGGAAAISGPARYEKTCIFWIQCDQRVLDARLDTRVDAMMEQGLLQELHDFHSEYRHNMQGHCDYTLGMFQSIGFKEFHNYLLLPEDERDTVKGRQLRDEGLELLKLATRQYAKRQVKWIRNRFLKRPGPGVLPVYGVDSTDVSLWADKVLKPACDILTAIQEDESPGVPPLESGGAVTEHVYNVCDVCAGRVFTTLLEWEAHTSSRKHKRALSKQRKQMRRAAMLNSDKASESTE